MIYKIPKFGTQLKPPFIWAKIPQPEVYWGGEKKFVHGQKTTNPLKGRLSEVRSVQIPALERLLPYLRSGSRWNWRSSLFLLALAKFHEVCVESIKEKGLGDFFLFPILMVMWYFFLVQNSEISEVCWVVAGSFPLSNLRYWEGEGTVREFPRP